jgi:hypothetical protein
MSSIYISHDVIFIGMLSLFFLPGIPFVIIHILSSFAYLLSHLEIAHSSFDLAFEFAFLSCSL